MTLKIYSVKSNARRDARKFGLNPLSVEAVCGGFVIGDLRKPKDSMGNVRVVTGKRARLLALLRDGWQPMPALAGQLGWQPHTVRGTLSGLAKTGAVKIERRRLEGITQYRAVQLT